MNRLTAIRAAARFTPPPRVASPWAAPATLERVVWSDVFGTDHTPLTRAEAMSVPAVARARRLIATSVARLPLVATDTPTGNRVTSPPRWLDRTDGPIPAYHRMLWTVDDLLFYGWSLWTVQRGTTGTVRRADRVPVDRWTFDTDGTVLVDDDPLPADRAVLIPGVDDGLLADGARAIRHGSHLIAAAERAAETPTANLELHQTNDAPMKDDEIKALVETWAAARRGRNGGVAYTNNAIEVREHGSVDPHLLVEGRNAAAVDIARAAGIPAAMLDAAAEASSMTYQTVAGRNRELIAYGLAPFMAAVSSRLSLDDMTPRGTRLRFDTDDFTAETVEDEPDT